MEKEFFDVFPNLKVKDQLKEWLDMVKVTRVSCNPDKTRLWVYIASDRWIHKKVSSWHWRTRSGSSVFPALRSRSRSLRNFTCPGSTHRIIFWKFIIPVWNWN